MKNLVLIMLFAVVAALFPVSMSWAAAEESAVGSVVAVRGEVAAIDQQGTTRALALKSPVFRREKIRTGKGARLQLLFRDNSIVSLGENSALEIDDYDWDAQRQSGTMKTRVEEGVFRVLGGMISKTSPKNFTTETPAATIGIRGSMYAGSYRQNKLQVLFLGGTGIYVSNSYGRVDIDKPGYGTWVILGQAPQEPVKMEPQEVVGILEGLSSGGFPLPGGSPLAPEFAEFLGNGIPGDSATDPAVVKASAVASEVTETYANDKLTAVDGDHKGGGGVPEASADSFTTTEDTPLLIESHALLANDSDGKNGLPAFDGIVLPPGNGQLTDNGDGTFSYVPGENYFGPDSFVYQVVNNRGVSSQATVSLTVTPVNDLPVAVARNIPVDEDSAGIVAFAFSDVDSASFSVTHTEPSHGNLVPNADGTLTYTPDPDFNGTDSFTYTVFDDSGGTSTAAVTITVAAMPETLVMSGQSQTLMRRLSNGSLVDAAQLGMTASVVDGLVSPELANGKTLQPFTMTNYDPAAAYSSYDQGISGEMVTIATAMGPISTTRDINWDNKGEFFVYKLNFPGALATVNGVDYRYQSLAIGGVPTLATSLPSTGIDAYSGEMLGGELATGLDYDASEFYPTAMYVNWSNRKVFGMNSALEIPLATGGSAGPSPANQLYYYGDYSAGPSSLRFVSGEGWMGAYVTPPEFHTKSGASTLNQFYGSEYQGFGLMASGVEYNVYDMAPYAQWQATAGLFRAPGMTEASPSGVKTLTGFYVIQGGYPGWSSYSILQTGSDLTLTVDAVNGTVSGSLGGDSLGGSALSAYVADDRFIAEFVPGGRVQSEGGFLVTAAPVWQAIDYVSWGYWNQVQQMDNGGMYHIQSPGSLWVAGEATQPGVLQGLVSSNMTGTYDGPAYGVKIDLNNLSTPLTNGQADLSFGFGTGVISGSISSDQGGFPVNAGYSWAQNLPGNFTATTTEVIYIDDADYFNTSTVTGGFFGPNAETIAGSFQADIFGDGKYSGIFGGNRISLNPAPVPVVPIDVLPIDALPFLPIAGAP